MALEGSALRGLRPKTSAGGVANLATGRMSVGVSASTTTEEVGVAEGEVSRATDDEADQGKSCSIFELQHVVNILSI